MSRLKIHHYAEAGLPHHEIARLCDCCERTVRNVLAEPPPSPAEVAGDQRAVRGPDAPSKTAPNAEHVAALLRSYRPKLTAHPVKERDEFSRTINDSIKSFVLYHPRWQVLIN